jgi:hypothetical protein
MKSSSIDRVVRRFPRLITPMPVMITLNGKPVTSSPMSTPMASTTVKRMMNEIRSG